jgi:segregation and condensation protein B
MGGGAAFWAARGVRIEPEVIDDEEPGAVEESGPEPDDVEEPTAVPEARTAEEVVEEPETDEAVAATEVPEARTAEEVVEEPEPEDVGEPTLVPEARTTEEIVEEPEPEDVGEPTLVPEARTTEEIVEEPETGLESDEPTAIREARTAEEFDAYEPEPVERPEPEILEETSLPGFPQQRSSGPAPAEHAASAEVEEPAWQLSGGELAAPLPPLKTCLEAVLMVVDEPVSVVTLAQVLERPTAEVGEALRELAEEYTVLGRGFELREVGLGGEGDRTGWRVYSRAECAPVVERFVRDGQQAKLTQAALETLAVVAYRQPVSRSKVSAIRGVNCDGVMRTLLARGLVEDYGNDHETGAVLYQTTGYFLERMGLKSLEELPDLAPLLPSAADVDVEDFA